MHFRYSIATQAGNAVADTVLAMVAETQKQPPQEANNLAKWRNETIGHHADFRHRCILLLFTNLFFGLTLAFLRFWIDSVSFVAAYSFACSRFEISFIVCRRLSIYLLAIEMSSFLKAFVFFFFGSLAERNNDDENAGKSSIVP